MKTISLTRGYAALVDDEDYERVSAFKWHALTWTRADGSISARAARSRPSIGKTRAITYMHAFICGYRGPDHIDGDGLNNQKHNLRPANSIQNGANRRKTTGLSSRFLGVTKQDYGWTAKIGKHRKYLGYFSDEADAAQAYNLAAIEIYGEFARLNSPQRGSGK